MKKGVLLYTIISLFTLISCNEEKQKEIILKDAFAEKFLIGMAMNSHQINGSDSNSLNIVAKHCNTITAENCMKSEKLQPEEGKFYFSLADSFIAFGQAHDMKIIGHTLIWHSQAPDWFFVDEKGNDVTKEVLVQRMKDHISTVVGRFKGKVDGWDVVNEAILDDGSWRKSKFYKIIGKDFLKMAFQFAHEADPEAELYYNDYSMSGEGKRNAVIAMVNELKEENIRIDGIGMQAHCGLSHPSFVEFEKSIKAFSETGLKIMITELDISVLPLPRHVHGADINQRGKYMEEINPYKNGLPDSVYNLQKEVAIGLFSIFNNYSDHIDRVTLWGVNDNQSWKNNWPIPGRTDYPLFFDREYKIKPLVNSILLATNKEDQI